MFPKQNMLVKFSLIFISKFWQFSVSHFAGGWPKRSLPTATCISQEIKYPLRLRDRKNLLSRHSPASSFAAVLLFLSPFFWIPFLLGISCKFRDLTKKLYFARFGTRSHYPSHSSPILLFSKVYGCFDQIMEAKAPKSKNCAYAWMSGQRRRMKLFHFLGTHSSTMIILFSHFYIVILNKYYLYS
jgi:hypothetical protein